ncbi:hypothetical protein FDECE_7973 [Fusarium decemcellulare]|nr:hypothetical protein FDECE_7973 [Fusarium decemcellulare]
MAAESFNEAVLSELKRLYSSYYHAQTSADKEPLLSPSCRQICRTSPEFAAENRDKIMEYIRDMAAKQQEPSAPRKSYYTIRALGASEFDFGADEIVQPAGFASTAEVEQRARKEGWVGTRVDICDQTTGEGSYGFLVKMRYWWKRENGSWVQILHDIMYMGPFDGSEGTDGELQP